MWVLYLLSWVSSLLVAIFALVCISAGLYFLAEAIEVCSPQCAQTPIGAHSSPAMSRKLSVAVDPAEEMA